MVNNDKIEFYADDNMVCVVASSMVPAVGSKISIRGKTWAVTRITYALDHADERHERSMRANIDVVRCGEHND